MSKTTPQRNPSTVRKWKRYPKYKDSGVEWLGEVPERWGIFPIKRLFFIKNGSTPKSTESEFWDGNIPWVTPEDLGKLTEAYIGSTRRMITSEGYNSCGTFLVPKDSIVVSTRAPIGYLAIANRSLCTNQGCKSLIPRKKQDCKFYYYLLLAGNSELDSWGQGATFRELDNSHLSEIFIEQPPFTEQTQISGFLDNETAFIDSLIKKKERQIQYLNEKRAAIIGHAITNGIDSNVKMKNSTIEWIAKIPEKWNEMRAKDLFRQLFLPSETDAGIVTVFRDGQVTLRTNRRTEGFTNAILEVGYQGIRNGDLVIHSMDAFAGAIGVSDSDGKCTGEYVVCEPIRTKVNNFYYGLFLREMALAKYILAICPSVRERAPRFRFNTFKEVILPVPPIEEQNEIVTYIETESRKIDGFKEKVQRSIDLLKEYQSSLISAAVTGKIDVRQEVSV